MGVETQLYRYCTHIHHVPDMVDSKSAVTSSRGCTAQNLTI